MVKKTGLKLGLPLARNLATSLLPKAPIAPRPAVRDQVSRGEITELFGRDLDPERLDNSAYSDTEMKQLRQNERLRASLYAKG